MKNYKVEFELRRIDGDPDDDYTMSEIKDCIYEDWNGTEYTVKKLKVTKIK